MTPHPAEGGPPASRLTPDEAREVLGELLVASLRTPACTDALAALVDWPALLAAGERAGKVASLQGRGDPPMTYGYGYWRLTDPEAAP